MQIIKEKLEIEETLRKRVKNILMFLNLKGKLEKGNIINIPKPTITGKEVKIDKETYEVLKDFMNTSKRVIKEMPIIKHYLKN